MHCPHHRRRKLVLPHLVHAALGTVLPMRLAGIVEAFAAGAAARMPRHRRAAIRAEEEPRQRQRPLGAGRQAHVAPRQLAHQAEGGRVHYRLVRAGRAVPLGLVDGKHRLAPEIGLAGLALHERARIGLVRQDAQHRARVPQVKVDPLVKCDGVTVATRLPIAGEAGLDQQPLALVVVVGRNLSRQCGTRAHDAHPFCQDENARRRRERALRRSITHSRSRENARGVIVCI